MDDSKREFNMFLCNAPSQNLASSSTLCSQFSTSASHQACLLIGLGVHCGARRTLPACKTLNVCVLSYSTYY